MLDTQCGNMSWMSTLINKLTKTSFNSGQSFHFHGLDSNGTLIQSLTERYRKKRWNFTRGDFTRHRLPSNHDLVFIRADSLLSLGLEKTVLFLRRLSKSSTLNTRYLLLGITSNASASNFTNYPLRLNRTMSLKKNSKCLLLYKISYLRRVDFDGIIEDVASFTND
jgi:hypothetical protein